MSARASGLALVLAAGALMTATLGCSKKPEPTAAKPSLSCWIENQHRCEEAPSPDKSQEELRTVECSSVSGKLSRPAACPTAGFLGKCTTADQGITSVHRWYTGADAEYQKSFCADPAKGVWSTAF